METWPMSGAFLYEGISRCNIVLARIPPIDMDLTLQSKF
jgi:hypothetical protein